MVLEKYQKEAEKVASAGKPPETEERTLKSILADKEDGILFNKMLDAKGRQNLAVRLLGGSLERNDLIELDVERKDFVERKELGKEISEGITPDLLTDMMVGSPELKQLVNLAGAEGVRELVKKHVREIALSDPTAFDDVRMRLGDLKSYREGAHKTLDEQIAKDLKTAGVKEDAFASVMQETDDTKRAVALKAAIPRDFLRSLRVMIRTVSGGALFGGQKSAREWARELSGKKADLDNALATVSGHVTGLGEALSKLVSDSDKVRAVFAGEVLGDKQKSSSEISFRDMRGKMPTETNIKQDWNRGGRPRGFEKLSLADQDKIKDDFLTQWGDVQEKKMRSSLVGVWEFIVAGFIRLLSGSTFDKSKLT